MPVVRTAVARVSVSDIPAGELGFLPGRRLITKWTGRPDIEVMAPGAALLTDTFRPQPATSFGPGVFDFWGYVLPQTTFYPGDTIELTLYWQVMAADFMRAIPMPSPATAAPLAIFVHFSTDDPGRILSQYDGWDVALTGLEAGDVIRYPLAIPVPPETRPGNYYLRLGLYSPQNGARLPVTIGKTTTDLLTLSPVTVK
jgi:hypothetical protein